MMCAVRGCKNCNNKACKSKTEDVSYFQFPKNRRLLKIWIKFCRRKEVFNTATGRICSEHFTPDDIERNLQFELGFMSKKRIRLKPGSVPSVYKITDKDDSSGRKSRILARANKKIVADLLNASTNEADTEDENEDKNEDEEEEECIEFYPQNALDPIDVNGCKNCDSLKIQMNALQLKMNTMEERCKRFIINEGVLKDKIKSLELELELELEQNKLQNTNTVTTVPTISSDVQIQTLASPDVKQQRWSKVDIIKSKKFYSANSKAYKVMRTNGVPLPSERTLQRWTQMKKIRPESLEPVATDLEATTDTEEVQIIFV